MTDVATQIESSPPSGPAVGGVAGRVVDVVFYISAGYLGLLILDIAVGLLGALAGFVAKYIFSVDGGISLSIPGVDQLADAIPLAVALLAVALLAVVRAAIRSPEPAFWRDLGFLQTAGQATAVVVVFLLIGLLAGNLTSNLEDAGIATDFSYLDQPTNFDIAYSGFEPAKPIGKALLVGIKNTFASAIIGMIFCTIIGVIVGVMRLSENWLARKLATVYVETIRNIPPLLVIILVMQAVILPLPLLKEASTPLGLFIFSNKEIGVPSIASRDNFWLYVGVVAFAVVVGTAVAAWRTHKFNQTGVPHHRVLWGGGVFLAISLLGYWALGGPFALSRPELAVEGEAGLTSVMIGGVRMSAAYVAITVALTIYTASHIAEIVRGSIQAVPHGQTEAAQSVALTSFQRLRFIILPQAFRVATPPTINQYLNLVKNTSLGIAVGYAEITLITKTVIGNANPAPQNILVLMGSYLAFSLTISVLVNILNRRLQLKTN